MRSTAFWVAWVLMAWVIPVSAQIEAGGGPAPISIAGPCLTDADREAIFARLARNKEELGRQGRLPAPDRSAVVGFEWPVRAGGGLTDPGVHGVSGFVDQNPANPGAVLDYNCGNRTYDISGYNHQGVDIFSWPFPWYRMGLDQVLVVAAAPGTIVGKSDGFFDHNCGFGGGQWNAVYVQHADGSTAWYGHLKNGSTLAKGVGETVLTGEVLGVIGSSGNSTGPHLHFEVYDVSLNLIETFAGPCNQMSAVSWWAAQRPYYDSALNAIMTHDAAPVFPPCPQTETPNAQDVFTAGQAVHFAAYYRDQLTGQVSTYRVRDPNGVFRTTWNHSSPAAHYAASYWAWSYTPPSDAPGVWTFEVSYLAQTLVHRFIVSAPTGVIADGEEGTELGPIRPHPVRASANLEFSLARSGVARLIVRDAQGRRVATLADGWRPAGTHVARWAGRDDSGRRAAPGVYFAQLRSGGELRTRRLVVVE
jgi:murein DD-endopeptidase MepM/ murein hydrolase activator NlpD